MTLRLATATQNAIADAAGALIDAGAAGGTIDVYTGAQPASANDPATGTLLATFTLADPAFALAANGSKALSGTPIETTGLADGDAGWFRLADSNGATVLDGACGTSGEQLNLSSVTIAVDGAVSITSGTLTEPAA